LVPAQAALRLPLVHLLKHQPLQPAAHQHSEALVLGLAQQQQLVEVRPRPLALAVVPAQQLRKAQVSTLLHRQPAQRQQHLQQHPQQQVGSTSGAQLQAPAQQQHLRQQAQHQLLQELAGSTLAVQLGPRVPGAQQARQHQCLAFPRQLQQRQLAQGRAQQQQQHLRQVQEGSTLVVAQQLALQLQAPLALQLQQRQVLLCWLGHQLQQEPRQLLQPALALRGQQVQQV
jgi:hypothetical protein